MRGSIWHTAGLLVLATVLGGCIGAESTPPAEAQGNAPQVASGPASFDETTGAISGTITDEELQPIAGALIGILPNEQIPEGMQVVSDAAGGFSFSRVPPGSHAVAGSALGYASSSKRVDVVVGAVTEVTLVVEKLAMQSAYGVTEIKKGTVDATMWRLTPQCMYFSNTVPPGTPSRNLLKTCGGAGGADWGDGSESQPHWTEPFYKENNWRTIVAELEWQPQSAATGKGFLMDLNAPNITRSTGGSIDQADSRTWVQMSAKSPLHIRVDNPTTLLERNIPESDWYSYPDTDGDGHSDGCTAPTEGTPNCDWFIRLFGAYCDVSSIFGDNCFFTPVDFGRPTDQPVTLYFSYFFMEPADPAFTALPDS